MSQAGVFGTGAPFTTQTLTGNVGGPVGPTGNNINVVGDGITITVTGNPGTSTLTISSLAAAFQYTNVLVTPYLVIATDYYLSVNTTIAPITILLPDNPGYYREFVIKDRTNNASVNNVTVTTVSGITLIDGVASYIMNTDLQSINIVFNLSNYEVW